MPADPQPATSAGFQPPSKSVARRSIAALANPRSIPRTVYFVGIVVFALTLPGWLAVYQLDWIIGALAFSIAALGLDILIGQAGQVSLAQAAFVGVGAVTAIDIGSHGLPWPVAFLAAMVICGVLSGLVGIPLLRARGLQVAIATLVFQLFAQTFLASSGVVSTSSYFNRPSYLTADSSYYYFSLILVVLAVIALKRVRITRPGRTFLAVRDSESRVAAFGIRAGTTKLLAYAMAGAAAGLGGAIFALQQGSLGPTGGPFQLQPSLLLVAVALIGGAGSPTGIIAASIVVNALPHILPTTAGNYTLVAVPVLMIVIMIFQPRGFGGFLKTLDTFLGNLLAGKPARYDPEPKHADIETTRRCIAGLREAQTLREHSATDPAPAARSPLLFVAKGITVRFGGVTALDSVDIAVERGKIVGLIGSNGAGKSTFFNVVSGLVRASGSIQYAGVDLMASPAFGRKGLGVARTFQEIGIPKQASVLENMVMAQSSLARYWTLEGILALPRTISTERKLRRQANLSLELFGLDHLADIPLGDLPHGTMRLVEVAAAVTTVPDLLLLDEATAGLTSQEADALADRLRLLRDEMGVSMLVIEHHVPFIANVCDYCYCLDTGKVIASGPPAEVTREPIVITSFLGEQEVHRTHRDRSDALAPDGELATDRTAPQPLVATSATAAADTRTPAKLLEVNGLCSGYGSLQVLFDVSFWIAQGEIVLLMGSNGAGKTTTLRTLCGLIKPKAGRIVFAGRDITGRSPEDLVTSGLVMVPEGRGMLPELTVAENLHLGAYTSRNNAEIKERLDASFETFPILAKRSKEQAGSLSGGEQQMLAIARALMSNPQLLLIDEASLGLSPLMTETTFEMLSRLNTVNGLSILVVEQKVAALDLAKRVYVMEKGQISTAAEGTGMNEIRSFLEKAYLGSSLD
ncbi:MAG: ATP-binding cassette domain-containing protein [Actinomycetota bacterium]|nr:ATP-binding cassette domain-containing protein [Actinomycetota bacterium]